MLRLIMCSRALLLGVAFCSLVAAREVRGQFTTIYNIPPDPHFGDSASIGSNTQLNLFDGGRIDRFFEAGASNGTSTNVEVNVFGGLIETDMRAYNGSTVNISGGRVNTSFEAHSGSSVNISGGLVEFGFDAFDGSMVFISGGSVASNFDANSGSRVTISGGSVGSFFNANTGSRVNISGGSVGRFFDANAGSTVNISGGLVRRSFRAHTGGTVNLFGGEFRLDGLPLDGLDTIGSTLPLNVPDGSVLSGTLADGTAFAFSTLRFSTLDFDTFADGTLTLQTAALPAVIPALITLPGDPSPPGIRGGQTLVVTAGGTVGDNFTAGWGSAVNVEAGQIGVNFEAVGAHITIFGGSVGRWFDAFNGSTVDIFGGTVDADFDANRGSTVNISGGSIGSSFDAGSGSTVNISGGWVGDRFDASSGSNVNIFGGSFGDDFDANSGSTVNLFGAQFFLDGLNLADALTWNVPFTITDRDVTLSGLLADGSSFAFELNSLDVSGQDFFDPAAMLTVTLIAAGDANGDGRVDIDDLNDVRNRFGAMGLPDGSLTGDTFPFDGRVNIDDLNNVRNHFGESSVALKAIPEPGGLSVALLALVFGTPLISRRRKRRHERLCCDVPYG